MRDGSTPEKAVRIYADGCYDLFHYGHAQQFKQVKDMYKHVHLAIGVCTQADILKLKGPLVNLEKERIENVRNCKWVDEVIFPAPWACTLEFLKKHDIDYIAHDDIPYTSDGHEDIYAPFKVAGKFKATQRTDGVSTTDLINRVLKNRDYYFQRNLDRFIDREDMGLGILEYIGLKLKQMCKRKQRRPKATPPAADPLK